MSDPTYRIDVSHEPHDPWPWKARVWRLSDEELLGVKVGNDPEEVATQARELVSLSNTRVPGFSIYVNDEGFPVEGHSVKAS